VTARDEIRDASIARIAAIFPDSDLAYLLARLTAAEADADRAEADADRLADAIADAPGLWAEEMDTGSLLDLHDEALALRERPQ
jgi:hypothetical protein